MWKTQHVAVITVAVTILSVALTLYAQSRINCAIAAKAAELGGTIEPNPIQQMSALSAKKKKKISDDLMPKETPKNVRFEDPVGEKPQAPKGAGSRWTPLS